MKSEVVCSGADSDPLYSTAVAAAAAAASETPISSFVEVTKDSNHHHQYQSPTYPSSTQQFYSRYCVSLLFLLALRPSKMYNLCCLFNCFALFFLPNVKSLQDVVDVTTL